MVDRLLIIKVIVIQNASAALGLFTQSTRGSRVLLVNMRACLDVKTKEDLCAKDPFDCSRIL